MDSKTINSISSQILGLQTRHRLLETEINQLLAHAYVDQVKLQRLKKQKLRLKDQISRLRAQLIPDLDA